MRLTSAADVARGRQKAPVTSNVSSLRLSIRMESIRPWPFHHFAAWRARSNPLSGLAFIDLRRARRPSLRSAVNRALATISRNGSPEDLLNLYGVN
jgi:hypothetical protein